MQRETQDATRIAAYTSVRVNCSTCSRPIALTDNIESSDGHLTHADCKRPQILTAEERALVFVYCSDHAVAHCQSCSESFRFMELGADMIGSGRTNLCPGCRRDLTTQVRAHLFRCVTLPAEIRQKAQEVREAAQRLIKWSQELSDRSDVLIREAEALLLERQKALRTVMARRTAS